MIELKPGRVALIIFLALLAFYTWTKSRYLPYNSEIHRASYLLTGDAPFYMLGAHSFALDRDFNVHNNMVNRDMAVYLDYDLNYSSWFYRGSDVIAEWSPEAEQPPDTHVGSFIRWGYGYSMLIAPVYYLAFNLDPHNIRYYVITWMNVLAALLAVSVFYLALGLTGNIPASALAALSMGLADPVAFYSHEIYPDLPVALFSVLAVYAMHMRDKAPRAAFVTVTLCAVALPWLHVKAAAASVIIGIWFAVSYRRDFTKLAVFAGIAAIAAIGRLYYYKLAFGFIGLPESESKLMSIKNGFIEGFLALIIDKTNGGLFWHWPILIFAIAGIICLARSRDEWQHWLMLLLMLGAYYVQTAMYQSWQGGMAGHLRYAVPIMALLAPLAALGLARSVTRLGNIAWLIFAGAGAWGLASALYFTKHPGEAFDRYNWFLRKIFGSKIFAWLPSINGRYELEISNYDQLAGFLLVSAIIAGAAYLAQPDDTAPPPAHDQTARPVARLIAGIAFAVFGVSIAGLLLNDVFGGFEFSVAGLALDLRLTDNLYLLLGWSAVFGAIALPASGIGRIRLQTSFAVIVICFLLLAANNRAYRAWNILVLNPGETVSFWNDPRKLVFAKGWSFRERNRRWTDGTRATIIFRPGFTAGMDDTVTLKIRGETFGAQRLEFDFNGEKIPAPEISTDPGVGIVYTLKIPQKIVKAGNPNTLGLDLPDAVSPERDPRKLGFALIDLSLF